MKGMAIGLSLHYIDKFYAFEITENGISKPVISQLAPKIDHVDVPSLW